MKKQRSAGRPAKGKGPDQVNQPIKRREEVQHSNDEHINQDFPGSPPPSKKESISNGSANAFEGTEKMSDDDDDGHDRGK